MHNIDRDRVEWILANLETTHNKLRPCEVQNWENLYIDDVGQFFNHAIFGYMTKHHCYDDAESNLPGVVLKEFIAEFCEKIRRASSGGRPRIGLPLFDVVGRERMFAHPVGCTVTKIRGAR